MSAARLEGFTDGVFAHRRATLRVTRPHDRDLRRGLLRVTAAWTRAGRLDGGCSSDFARHSPCVPLCVIRVSQFAHIVHVDITMSG